MGVGGLLLSLVALNQDEYKMEAFGILGFVFGVVAFVRLEKLTKTLKEKGVLDESYTDE
jgi:hypothetical protein